ncbi:MAG: ATP-dependent RecD-like DNA helicase [Defluviitaleaceae bacterium]|nr:ATP-dependent RecD-like DNA helicase [Defluviitaleaceae bacterium]
MDKNQTTLQGMVENIIYHNDENGYTVFTVYCEEQPLTLANYQDDDDNTITCTGHFPDLHEGESLSITGTFVNNPRYGWQLAVSRAEKTVPSSVAGIEKYLGSGVIKGIGPRMAKRMVSRFGADTLDIIENEPEKLAELKGITIKRAIEFAEIVHAQTEVRRVMLFLHEYGISPVYAKKIHKTYKDATIEIVRQNPYKLADDIDGIGFKKADAIAFKLGISRDAPERISAGVRFILWEASNDGNVYITAAKLTAMAAELLGAPAQLIDNEMVRMQLARMIIREKDPENPDETLVFLSPLYYAEVAVARRLAALAAAHRSESRNTDDAKGTIAALERETEMELSEGQRQAVLSALTEGVLVITGGPGTGKTTAINTLIALLEHKGFKISLAAPTGRAAKRMGEATGRDAKTVHRLLEVSYISEDSRRQVFKKNEDEPLETDVLIVDEASMMDITLMHSMLKAVPIGTRLILVGDVDQLPSVGPGNVLKDIIASNTVAVVRLTEIFRQAAESAIITNAHQINQGMYPQLNARDKDFFFVKRGQQDDVITALLDLVTKRLPAYKNYDSLHDIQVLTPMRKSALGVSGLNGLLQARLNPKTKGKNEREFGQTIFREGDKVMQIRNNYDATWQIIDKHGYLDDQGEGVFNGDMGVIKAIDEDKGILTVLFDDKHQVQYDFTQLDELELAYAVTVHKSQGSEYKAVVMPIFGGPPMLLTRNLLYTAVTRAKELCVLVGIPECLHRMVDNNRITTRQTALARRLRDLFTLTGQDVNSAKT